MAVGEVHDGLCGTHQSAHKMKWMLRRTGYFWPTMLEDCFKYYKGCQDCQRFGKVQNTPASQLHLIVKPWLFRGWGIDIIGQIYLNSSKGHKFILATTDYFSKWVEAIPLKVVSHREVYRIGIPQTLTTDQGSVFMSKQFQDYARGLGIMMLNSSPYYAQANG